LEGGGSEVGGYADDGVAAEWDGTLGGGNTVEPLVGRGVEKEEEEELFIGVCGKGPTAAVNFDSFATAAAVLFALITTAG